MKKVSVVIPAMNEEANIARLLDDLLYVERNLKEYAFENIVVDDNSSDKTAVIAREKSCKVIRNSGKRGKGNALRLGFKEAKGDYIVMMDADYSHRPEDMPVFLEQLEKGAGLVIGSRILGGSEEYTRIRAFGNIFLTWVFGLLLGRYLSDALNGYKAFVRDLIKQHQYGSNNFEIEIELIANALRSGLNVVEVPSHERARSGGEAKSKVVKHGFGFLMMIIRQWARTKFKLAEKDAAAERVNIEYQWLERLEKLDKYNEWLFSHIKDYLGNSVWEAGAGVGTYSKYMRGVKFLVLSDVVDDYLNKLKIRFSNFNNIAVEKVDLVNDDYKKLGTYNIDTVVCINVLEHIDSDLKAMENIYNTLQPGGRFLFIGPNHHALYGTLDTYASHFRRYTKKQLVSSLNRIGFKVEKIFIVNSLAALNWFLQSRVLKRKIISTKDLERCEKLVPLAKFIDAINPFPIGSNVVLVAKK